MSRVSRSFLTSLFSILWICKGDFNVKAQSRILTITAKSYITELYVDDERIRSLINDARWYLSDDVDLTTNNRLISILATDASSTCGGILASVTGNYLVTDAMWKCSTENLPGWYALGFDDSSWSDAYVIGKNGEVTTPSACNILTEISSISPNASWIWTASMANAPVYDPIIYCRGYLPVCDLDSPCLNGGTCNRNAPELCTCPPGISGTYCEIVADEGRILTITAKSYISELYVDGTRIRNLINEGRWYLSDDVDLTTNNRLISIFATDASNTCGGILASVTNDYLVSESSWKCSTQSPPGWSALGFNDSSWSDAYVIGKNGEVTTPSTCNILIEISSISPNASWIWTASIANAPVYDPIIYCRGYLPVCDLDSPCQNGGTCNKNAPELCTCPLGFLGKYCENVLTRYLNITSQDSLSEVYVDGVSVPLLHRNEKDVVDSILLSPDNRLVAVMAVSSTDNCSAFIASVTDDYLVSNSTWKCSSYGANGWQYLGFDDSSWTSASIVGSNGFNPSCSGLGSISQISGNAFWIWSRAASEARGAVFCRGYLPLCTDGSPCENGGTCLDNNELVCLCTAEWTGRYCETVFTVCLSEPCQNNGSCSVIDNQYVCQCTDDYHGINCEKANNRSLLITANSTLYGVYVDELERPLFNYNKWNVADDLPITPGNRLIGVLAIGSSNTCSGILASVSNDLLVTDSSWKCSTNIPTDWFLFTFDDSSWEPAKVIGFNGNVTSTAECSWSTEVTPISKSASWIWMTTNAEGMIACRAYISICELDNPCRNGATCRLKDSLLCFCMPGYTGVYCEALINRTLAATVKAELIELHIDGTNLTLTNGADVTKPDEFYLLPFNRLVSLVALDTSVTCPGVLASVTGDYFVTDASWKCNIEGPPLWYALGFDDSSWEAAYAIGNNGAVTSPAQCTALPYIPSISANAKWIWTDSIVTDPVYDQNIFCRGYIPVCNVDTACWNGGTCNRNHATLCNCLPGFTGKNCEIDETKNLKITGEGKIYAAYADGIELTLRNGASSSLVDAFTVGSLTRLVAVMAAQLVDACPGVLASITDSSGDYFLTGTEWKCSPSAPVGWWNIGFDDSTWSPAVTVKQNVNSTDNSACPNLPPVTDITSSAQWIWTSNAQPFDMTVYCRGYPPACARAPCQNGGTCYSNSPQMCACQQSFTGIYCEQTTQLNEAALVGETVTMNCKRTNTNVTWWFTTPGSTTSSVIVSDCKVLPEYSGLYSVDTTDYACNLVMQNVQLSHAGTYACQEMSLTDVRTSAQLIILNGVQQCWSSLGSVVYGHTVTLTCQISYSGNWAPAFRWTDVYGQAVTNATTDITSSSVTSYIVIPAFFPNVPSFTSTVFFSESSLPDITDDIQADNTPTDVYNVATPVIDVVCPSGFTRTSQYHCYWFLAEYHYWHDAQSRCQNLYPGAYLVVISDSAEQIDIENHISGIGSSDRIWTSGYATDGCGNFRWQPLPGYFLPMTYANWAGGEPNCASGGYEPSVEMYNDNFKWNDAPPADFRKYCLCEYELSPK